MKELVVTDAARGDLREIAEYTAREWGESRRRRYLATIRDCYRRLRRQPELGHFRAGIRLGLRSVTVGRHVVFYRDDTAAVAVIRVLHERMDLHHRRADPAGD